MCTGKHNVLVLIDTEQFHSCEGLLKDGRWVQACKQRGWMGGQVGGEGQINIPGKMKK
jgi:hypothetical protein